MCLSVSSLSGIKKHLIYTYFNPVRVHIEKRKIPNLQQMLFLETQFLSLNVILFHIYKTDVM